jgi:hypothetical protein
MSAMAVLTNSKGERPNDEEVGCSTLLSQLEGLRSLQFPSC